MKLLLYTISLCPEVPGSGIWKPWKVMEFYCADIMAVEGLNSRRIHKRKVGLCNLCIFIGISWMQWIPAWGRCVSQQGWDTH